MATPIKPVYDENAEQYYPLTHTQAVVDNAGKTVEQRLQALEAAVFPKS